MTLPHYYLPTLDDVRGHINFLRSLDDPWTYYHLVRSAIFHIVTNVPAALPDLEAARGDCKYITVIMAHDADDVIGLNVYDSFLEVWTDSDKEIYQAAVMREQSRGYLPVGCDLIYH